MHLGTLRLRWWRWAAQTTVGAGPYASLGLADGSVQTSHSLPSYNPNVDPLGLVYNSTVANAQPIFLVHYQLNPSQSLPSSVTAQLTLTNGNGQTVYSGPTMYYNPSSLNPGDWMQMALQANATGLPTGRYSYQIQVTANGTPTTYSGGVNIVTSSTTPTTLTNNPFGAGWSLDNVARLYTASGGVMLQNPDGTSLWFANGGTAGTFVTPAGDFSTLTQNTQTGVYTRTLKDGTQINFNSSGQQTSIVDRNGNTTSFTYNGSGQLTSVTDMNGQVNTLTYNNNGLVTSITDPASRSLALAYNGSNQLTSLTDPNSAVWSYGYDSSGDLTQLSDPRSNLTQPNPTYTRQFTYSSGRVSSVTRPDGTAVSLSAVQVQGLGGTSSSPATMVLLAAVSANYTDPNNQLWQTYLDGLGFGQATEAVDPLGDTSLTFRDGNGLGWLSADPLGRRERYFFDSQANVTQVVHADDSSGGNKGMYSYCTFREFLPVGADREPTGTEA